VAAKVVQRVHAAGGKIARLLEVTVLNRLSARTEDSGPSFTTSRAHNRGSNHAYKTKGRRARASAGYGTRDTRSNKRLNLLSPITPPPNHAPSARSERTRGSLQRCSIKIVEGRLQHVLSRNLSEDAAFVKGPEHTVGDWYAR